MGGSKGETKVKSVTITWLKKYYASRPVGLPVYPGTASRQETDS